MTRGHLIVFTGIDGSGKTTQAKILVESLKQDGRDVTYVWSRWEPLLLRFIIKKWKDNVTKDRVKFTHDDKRIKDKKRKLLNNPVLRWLWLIFFFIDYGLQILFKIRIRLFKKRLIISDRIYYDSFIDQAVNFGERQNMLLNLLDSFWMKAFFPRPDLVIYVDCPEDIAFTRKNDPSTPNIEYLKDRRNLYLKLADKYQWIKMDGTHPVDKIALKVREKVYKGLNL